MVAALPRVGDIDHRATITQRLAAQMADRILTGAYQPGEAVREEELARHYAVSRHVIREMLRILAAEGLVDYASFRGARIPMFTAADAHDIYRARRLQECGSEAMSILPDAAVVGGIHDAFVMAVGNEDWGQAFALDVAFHTTIVAAANGARATRWHRTLMQDLRLAQLAVPAFNRAAFAPSIDQHAAIVSAIATGDAPGARAAMRRHLDDAEQMLVAGLAASRETAGPLRDAV